MIEEIHGLWGWSSSSTQQTFNESNVTPDRTFDADTVLVAELADIVGTLIVDLRARGIVD